MSAYTPNARELTPLEPILDAVESAAVLDKPAKAIAEAVRDKLSNGAVKDALSGTWLGHALHPLLTDVVVGSFTSATVLDLIGGRGERKASERLILTGILAYGPTALTGMSDWADAEPVDGAIRRTGLVHAASNSAALTLYASSLVARRQGARGRGVVLGSLGAMALGFAGLLGGHLSYRQGVGADQTVFDPGPEEWTEAAELSALDAGTPTRVVVADTPVLLLRESEGESGRILAIHDRCSHRGCSLSDGELDGNEIVCGCHGSRFRLTDGAVLRGPATAPQPAFEVRERAGRVEVRRTST